MAKNDLVSGLAMLVFGLVMLVFVIPTQIVEGGDYTISPALLPKICAIGISALAALNVIQALRRLRTDEATPSLDARPMPWGPALGALATVLASVLIFRFVHAAPAALLLVAALMLYMGERRWYLLVGLPLGLVAIGYVLLYEILGMVIA